MIFEVTRVLGHCLQKQRTKHLARIAHISHVFCN